MAKPKVEVIIVITQSASAPASLSDIQMKELEAKVNTLTKKEVVVLPTGCSANVIVIPR